ncbi:hypothetical protein [Streptomyces sp. SID13031]|uniref:hypothetical protein n=1 Tax=Streptomyces sp. SID13031 TaxID=2706046 RepID=UPI0013C7AE18|nr:hypothetical protein [Streptomyces sp. SID13031]NEA37347.1 hypothetical protein [Streptomyces sp. SID13031]
MPWKTITTALLGILTATLSPMAANAETTAVSYHDPSFGSSCRWHRFGEGEKPPWYLYAENPLCVEYSKRDITIDNGGALAFLLAEPSRFALALPSCRYWQLDHWSVQNHPGDVAYVSWNGSYWFDKDTGGAGILLKDFRINGMTVGVGDVVEALRPTFPALAEVLARYGNEAGQTGLSIDIPTAWWC